MCAIKPYVRKQLFVALCVYLGQMVLCFGRSWPNIGIFEEPGNTPLPYIITHTQSMVIDAVFHVGVILGCGTCGFLSNCSGRKPSFFISGLLSFVAFLLLATVTGAVVLGISKFLIGLGTGMLYAGIVVYLGEIASTNIRGFILTSVTMLLFLQNWLNVLIQFVAIPYSWLAYFGSTVSAIFVVAVFYIPESPVYLTMKGTNENLETTLIVLGREDEYHTMLSQKIELEALKKTHADNWLEIFKVKSNRKAVFITLTLNILQALSGYMGIKYFLPKFLFPTQIMSLELLSIIFIVCTSVGALCSLFLIEKLGRKKLLMISTGSCGASLVRGFRIIPEILVGEMFTTNVRSTGAAFVISMSVLTGYSVLLIADFIMQNVAFNVGLIFIAYCLTNITAFIFTLFLVPETKGLTFTEINEILNKKKLINLH